MSPSHSRDSRPPPSRHFQFFVDVFHRPSLYIYMHSVHALDTAAAVALAWQLDHGGVMQRMPTDAGVGRMAQKV